MMNNLPDVDSCIGCGVCQVVCPVRCIEMKEDCNGFKQVVISPDKCVHCLKCERYCPVLSLKKENLGNKKDPTVFACAHLNKNIQKKSSSGGFFPALCETFFSLFKEEAFIYGAVLQNDFSVCHEKAVTLEETKKFSGSKYLQSDIRVVLGSIKMDLELGKYVLFSGTPCQVAAVYSFLKKKYDRLYTCEVICHGVPSSYHFDIQRRWFEVKYDSILRRIDFRSKKICWQIPTTKYVFQSGKIHYFRSEENSFMNAFYSALNLRKSCYTCPYASLPRIADMTIGDFWGYEKSVIFNKKEIAKGISLILCNNEKGNKLFEKAAYKLKVEKSSLDKAISGNVHIVRPVQRSSRERDLFLLDVHNLSIEQINKKYGKIPFRKKIGIFMGTYLMKCFFYLKNVYAK